MSEQPFEGVLGNTVQLWLLQHLMSPILDFSITELQRVTGVSRPSVDKVVKMFLFLQWGVVRETVKRGNMTFYTINEGSHLVRSMMLFNNGLMGILFPELIEQPSDIPIDSNDIVRMPNAIGVDNRKS